MHHILHATGLSHITEGLPDIQAAMVCLQKNKCFYRKVCLLMGMPLIFPYLNGNSKLRSILHTNYRYYGFRDILFNLRILRKKEFLDACVEFVMLGQSRSIQNQRTPGFFAYALNDNKIPCSLLRGVSLFYNLLKFLNNKSQ